MFISVGKTVVRYLSNIRFDSCHIKKKAYFNTTTEAETLRMEPKNMTIEPLIQLTRENFRLLMIPKVGQPNTKQKKRKKGRTCLYHLKIEMLRIL